jgi:hypothetical protein
MGCVDIFYIFYDPVVSRSHRRREIIEKIRIFSPQLYRILILKRTID